MMKWLTLKGTNEVPTPKKISHGIQQEFTLAAKYNQYLSNLKPATG